MRNLSVLFLTLFLSFSLFADSEPTNDSCPGEIITEMHNITDNKTHEEGPASLTKITDVLDYYSFQIDAAGTLRFYFASEQSVNVFMNTSLCSTSNSYKIINNGSTGSATFNINSGDTVYIAVENKYNGTQDYGFDLDFKIAASPTANDDNAETLENTPVAIDVTGNDTDDGTIDKTTVTITSAVSHGSTSIDGVTGVVTYTPDNGFTGTDSFTYTVNDNLGNTSNEATVLIIVKVPTSSVENCTTGSDNGYRDFCLRRQTMLSGGMVTVGNTVIVPPDPQTTDCSAYTTGPFISDSGQTNQDLRLCEYKKDGGYENSTSAEVIIPDPANSTIFWAGLYWQALTENATNLGNMDVRIKNGSDAYVSIGGFDKLDYSNDSLNINGYKSYSAFKDITDVLINNNWSDGNYSVANIPAASANALGNHGNYGGWSLVVIYRNTNESIKSFSVFDGWKFVWSSNTNESVRVSGFYTPKGGDISSQVSIFTAESDKNLNGDKLWVENQKATPNPKELGYFDSSIDMDGTRVPNPVNTNGIDIHTYELGNVDGGADVLTHEQSDITFSFRTTTDASTDWYWPSMLAFATEVYSPSFCYDYAYSQHSVYITEENNDSLRAPRITGHVTDGDDLTVTLYIRNEEDSDVSATNLALNITDINTSQAVYKRNSVAIINPTEVVADPVPDSSLIVSDSYIKDIRFEDVAGKEYIYAYYALTPNLPSSLNHDINISLNGTFTYDLVLPLDDGSEITIPSISTLGGTNLPMCSASNFEYITRKYWSIFNVADTGIYTSSGEKYNIPTQTVRRPGNFTVVAYDRNASDFETPDVNSTTLVGVDMIDAGAFHDIIATCSEPTAGISPILWMYFDSSSTIDLNQEIATAISDNRLDIASVNDYFPNAVQSAAFRISYITTNDDVEDLVKTEPAGGNNVKLLNFTELVQDIHICKQPVKKFPDSDLTTDLVPVACANAGNIGLNPFEMQRCLECLFGYNTHHICSRDNFAIRPENFNVKLNDANQSNTAVTLRFADDRTGVTAPNTAIVDMAAGYQYSYEINATSHTGNAATPGYTRYFSPLNAPDYNITLIWEPTNAAVNPFCNDTNNSVQTFNMANGQIFALAKHGNIGEYRLNMIDKAWTQVDWDPAYMGHHSDSTYFVGGINGKDCDTSSSNVLATGTQTGVLGLTLTNLNGCTIDTNNHNNVDTGTKYRDYDITFHPYELNASLLSFTHGSNNDTNFTNAWVYMNNVATDNNQSVNILGNIIAKGYDGTPLSNFVGDCYAQPINLTVGRALPAVQPVSYNFLLIDTNGTDTLATITGDLNTTGTLLPTPTLTDGNFSKPQQGSTTIDLKMNFARTVNNPINPLVVNFMDFNVTCTTAANCQMQADLVNNHEARGQRPLNQTVTHYYGRLHAPRYRIEGNTGNINLFYEVYCDTNPAAGSINAGNPCILASHPVTMGSSLLSIDDIRWYQNEDHNRSEGNTTAMVQRNNAFNEVAETDLGFGGTRLQTWQVDYNENKGYPFKSTMEMSTQNWMLFHRFNPNAPTNSFELEFNSASGWVGKNKGSISVDSNASRNTTRRIEW